MKNNIQLMNYSQFVGLIDERNRPSGGIKTVQIATINSRITRESKVLEIGSNTGFTSVNINLLTGAKVTGVDSNTPSITKSREYAALMGAKDVSFIEADTLSLPFDDAQFDMVWCSNVTSFIADKEGAISEYLRVLKPFGTLVLVPIYYHETPPKKMLNDISDAIASEVKSWNRQMWLDLFKETAVKNEMQLELYFSQEFKYLDQTNNLDGYVDLQLHKLDKEGYSEKERALIELKAKHFYSLFNENNYRYARYSVMLLQKRNTIDEVELFTSREVFE